MSSNTNSASQSENELSEKPQISKPVLRPRVKQANNSDLAGFSSDLSDLSDAEDPPIPAKAIQSRGSGNLKIVPYDPVVIPFGERAVETILSYRYDDGKEEFLVKFKYTSHHHLEWLDRETIERETPAAKMRLKKFLEQFTLNPSQFDEPFNPTFLEVDRVLDEGELESSEEPEGIEIYLLVKWCGLPYDCSTWEKFSKVEELSKEKVEEFHRNQIIPDNNIPVSAPIPTEKKFEKLEASPEFKEGNTLRDYQLEGLNWFTFCWQNQRSCIMADEMGLGKTVQSVSFLYHIHRSFQIRGPFIIVAPLSTLPHWEREFRAWTDLNVIVYHGSSTSRNLIVDTEFYFKDIDGNRASPHYKFDVLITTYEMILVGASQLKPIAWRVAIFDEAHRLKNKNSKMLETLKTYKLEHRVLLTGTPLQNSVAELFSLLNFLNPSQFSDEDKFLAKFGDLKSLEGVKDLQDILKPLMLRRFKEDVEKSLPDKEETVVEVELTSLQKTWYRAILERNFTWIRRTKGSSNGPSLRNIMMEIRKCCNHPFLVKGADDVLKDCDQRDNEIYLQALISSSGKLVLLDKLLPKLKDGGHKVLIFSQMTRMLDILGTYLFYRGYPTERIDGSVKSQDRQAAIDRFSTSPDSFTFLLCTRAGGVGINLTAADTVVIFDSDWNPQNDLQAQARVHRIGQTKPVKIYRLLCANTYEREMFDRANLKLGLDKAVMQKMEGAHNDTNSSDSNLSLSKKEIEDLLKLGAYGALLDDNESSKFFDEDIDQILERRSTVVRYDANQKGTAFSKASFAVRDGDNTDLNDPEFWDKWAKRANVAPEYIDPPNPLIIDEPRVRKRPSQFQDSAKMTRDSTINDEDLLMSSDNEEERMRFWSPTERVRLERNLTIYGVSNWDKFVAAMPRRSLKDIQACVIQFFQFIGKGISSELTKSFTQVTKAFYDQNPEFSEWEKVQAQAGFPYPGATPQQTSEFRSFLDETTQEYCDRIIRKAKNLLKRIYSLHVISEMVGDEEDKFVVPVISDPFPATWWSTQADRDLIIGTKRHGFLQLQAFQDDTSLIFSTLDFGVETIPLELDEKRPPPSLRHTDGVEDACATSETPNYISWPSNSDLKIRVSAILSQFGRSDTPPIPKSKILQTRAQNYLDDQISALRNGTNLEYDIEMDPTWSNKEHKNFSRLLTSFGLETATAELGNWRWSRFRILSSLNNKSDEDLNAYLTQFINLYHQILFDPSGDSVREKNSDVAEFLTRLKEAVSDSTSDFNIEVPSPEKAKRLIKRVMLMHAIRHEVLPAVPTTGRIPAGFPDWWRSKHEAPFVEAVTIYGFSREDLITKDKNLPFTNIDPRDWVKESPIVKHLETLVELLKNPSRSSRRALYDGPTESSFGIISFQNGRSPSPRAHYNDQYSQRDSSRYTSSHNGRRFTQMVVYDSPQGPILVKDPHFVPRESDNRHSNRHDDSWPSPGRKSRSRVSPPYRDSRRERSRSPRIQREARSHYFESPSPC